MTPKAQFGRDWLVLRAATKTPIIIPDITTLPIRPLHGTPVLGLMPDRMAEFAYNRMLDRVI